MLLGEGVQGQAPEVASLPRELLRAQDEDNQSTRSIPADDDTARTIGNKRMQERNK